MNTNTVESKLSMIACITRLREAEVTKILNFLEQREPTTVGDAKDLCESSYASEEQKAAAQKVWSKLTCKELEKAARHREIVNVLRYANKDDTDLCTDVINKGIERSNTVHDVEELWQAINGFQPHDKKSTPHQTGVLRNAMVEKAKCLEDYLSILPFLKGSDFEKEVRIRIDKMIDQAVAIADVTQREHSLLYLYNVLNDNHVAGDLRINAFRAWVMTQSNEVMLRHLYVQQASEIESQEKCLQQTFSSGKEKIEECLRILRQIHVAILERLETIVAAKIENTAAYDELIEIGKTLGKPELKDAKVQLRQKLLPLWKKKLEDDLAFADAKRLLCDIREINNKDSKIEDEAWKALNGAVSNKAQAREALDLDRFEKTQGDAARTWIAYRPTFEELFEALTEHYTSTSLRIALARSADAPEKMKKLFLCTDFDLSTKEGEELALKYVPVIASVIEGMNAFKRMEFADSDKRCIRSRIRLLVLNRVLELAKNIEEFEFVTGDRNSFFNNEEKVVLVAKARSLLSAE